ncbi:ABC-2 type transport system ATP-binding protein [Salinibacillus kushneri]|uniref:ABC-2 type transport system ATP-binding protein n=1 Tax=Salinibacillus kushneri TaxID=237682 RepID=A0A1I0AQF2_9BACI|nr:ABC transporter ATP-binding protein [Salinibacillus kushneri]SES96552.1 ABC-2 type transport system ATP-binding protein [Salinibacillus kushneri]
MIQVDQINKYIKKNQILNSVSATIHKGDSIGIIGPNGAGKSTFLKILASILKPDRGKIYYQGASYKEKLKELRSNIGYIPQDIALYEDLTVQDQILFWQKASKQKVAKEYVNKVMSALDLFGVQDKKVKALSGGWKRKVNVSIGLLHNPELILLDEPTAGVDLAAKEDLIQWLKLLQQGGKTLVMVSHDWDILNRICEKIMIFQKGKLIFFDAFSKLEEFELNNFGNETDKDLGKLLKLRMR